MKAADQTAGLIPTIFRVPLLGSAPPALAGWGSSYNEGRSASRVAAIRYGIASIILYGLQNVGSLR